MGGQVRLNMANSWAPGERTDVWVARHCARRPAAFYGFDVQAASMTDGEVESLYSVRVPPTPSLLSVSTSPAHTPTVHPRGLRLQSSVKTASRRVMWFTLNRYVNRIYTSCWMQRLGDRIFGAYPSAAPHPLAPDTDEGPCIGFGLVAVLSHASTRSRQSSPTARRLIAPAAT